MLIVLSRGSGRRPSRSGSHCSRHVGLLCLRDNLAAVLGLPLLFERKEHALGIGW